MNFAHDDGDPGVALASLIRSVNRFPALTDTS
ncbi:MAG: hypothetical protein K0Q52_2243 [Microbacterium sp.]|jgi:hypothetical protein|nr:hypothetical protein [Microbacterium sp.]